jgi:hypothetical protein
MHLEIYSGAVCSNRGLKQLLHICPDMLE